MELVAVRSGDVLTLYPATMTVAEMVKRLSALPAPPSIEQRDDSELPERVALDRMIAAQALGHRAELITFNPDDISDVPGLKLRAW